MKIIAFTVTIFLFSNIALACKCRADSAEQHFARAEYVFRATITQITVIKTQGQDDGGSIQAQQMLRVEFDLVDTYKGNPSDLPVLITRYHPTSCGLPVSEGDDYIFFSDSEGSVGMCGGSMSAERSVAAGLNWSEFVLLVQSMGSAA